MCFPLVSTSSRAENRRKRVPPHGKIEQLANTNRSPVQERCSKILRNFESIVVTARSWSLEKVDTCVKDIIVYGAGGFGMEVAFLIEDSNKACLKWNILGYIDDDRDKWGTVRYGYKVLGGREWLKGRGSEVAVALAVAIPEVRRMLAETVFDDNVEFPVLIHPSVILSRAVNIREGSIICAGTILTVEIDIGHHVHINPGCTIGHEVTIEDYATLYPGVNVAGNVVVRSCASLGTGCQIVQGLEVGSHAFLGAGSVAIRAVPSGMVAAGCPAQVKKRIWPKAT
jgi:sugar O-acyltransferase (sialic acid O-acetyltransferase NeuD family)